MCGHDGNRFDAVTPYGATEVHARGHIERSRQLDEKTRDADDDMVMHLVAADSGIGPATTTTTTEACVKDKFTSSADTVTLFGGDSVTARP